MVKRSVLFIVVLMALAAPGAFSQIEEQVSVGIIEIWVKVTNGGNEVINDLRPDDFTIFIDGKKTDLRCFDRTFDAGRASVADMPVEQAEDTDKSGRQKRTFILFFDLLNSSTRDMDYLKLRVEEFLNHSFHDDDEGIIFALLPSVNLGVVQKLTSSKEALIGVVRKMGGNPTLEKRVRNNEKELMNVLYAFGSTATSGAGDRAGVNSRSPETILQARGLARTFAAQDRNLSKLTLNSFLTIGEYLASSEYEGRPVMIYLSGGFSMRPGQNYYEMVQKAIEDQFVRGTEDMAYWEYPPDNDFEGEVKKTIGLLNRLNVTIYSIDANGLDTYDRSPELNTTQVLRGPDRASHMRELQDSLAMVSRETGGLAFLNTQNFIKGLDEITSDMGQQYWLCANLPPSSKRGAYHKIEVKVDRDDVSVRHRQGYVD